jgi:hypothetical protein
VTYQSAETTIFIKDELLPKDVKVKIEPLVQKSFIEKLKEFTES